MRAEIIAVGTELLLGDVVNTNAAWLGQRLTEAGVDITGGAVVGDNVARIAAAVAAALDRADTVIVCGGLGPTQDDLTRDALARVAGVGLRRDQDLVSALRERFAGFGRPMPERNLQQADLPEGARPLPNPVGTAPGIRLEVRGAVIYALPGVPHELEAMAAGSVLPDVLRRGGEPSTILSRVVRTAGIAESTVAEALAELDAELAAAGNPTLAYLASEAQVRVRITAKAPDRAAAEELIRPVQGRVRAALGRAVYGADEDTLDGVVHAELRRRGATVAVAESLTGGLLGALLTNAAGASATFLGSLVVYATSAKAAVAGVPDPLLDAEGPVSAQVAAALAAGARDRFGATYGLGLTGVAGPDPQNGQPPGTVHVALAGPAAGAVRSLRLPGDRARVRLHAATAALDLLRRRLADRPGAPGDEPARD